MRAQDIDDMLGIPARLAIVASLAPGPSLSFTELKAATGLADGNLYVQTRRLLTAGWLVERKDRRRRRQVTRFQLTATGLEKLRDHVLQLQEALEKRAPAEAEGKGTPKDGAMVW